MSILQLDDQIKLATQQLTASYMELVALQQELLFLIEQEEERLVRLKEEDVQTISDTFNKIPLYREKLAQITKSMALITKRAQKLKRRAGHVEQEALKMSLAK